MTWANTARSLGPFWDPNSHLLGRAPLCYGLAYAAGGLDWRTRLWFGGLASTGVVVAQALTYAIVGLDLARSAELFTATEPGELWLGGALAFGLAIAALSGFALDRRSRNRPIAGRTPFGFVPCAVGGQGGRS